MAITVAQKLRIKEDSTLLTLNAPANFETQLEPLPTGVKISEDLENFNQVHWFVYNKLQLDAELSKVLDYVKNDVICWIYYPKGTSKIQTDLTRDKGWENLMSNKDLQWLTLISFDSTWSTFGFRRKSEATTKKEEKSKVREIFNYINAEKKEIRLPDDLFDAFKVNTAEELFFNSLSFTNKKEYVEWIITAKREETRKQRVTETIEKLKKGLKNPTAKNS